MTARHRRAGLRRLSALALLRGQMPLLRFQQPCPPPAGRPATLCRGVPPRDGDHARLERPAHGDIHVSRRRHAVADGARNRGRPLETADESGACPDGIEITLEANPSSVEAGRFRGYRAAGVNRVSLGVQALNDTDLKFLGRLHNVDDALKAIRLARDIFPRMSFDLIYARPGQTVEAWERELRRRSPMPPTTCRSTS